MQRPEESDNRHSRDTHDPTDREYHLRRVCAQFPTTISPAKAAWLAELLGLGEQVQQELNAVVVDQQEEANPAAQAPGPTAAESITDIDF